MHVRECSQWEKQSGTAEMLSSSSLNRETKTIFYA